MQPDFLYNYDNMNFPQKWTRKYITDVNLEKVAFQARGDRINALKSIYSVGSSRCGTKGSTVSLPRPRQIPGLVPWDKDPALPQLWHRLQWQLKSAPWPGNSVSCEVAKKEKILKIKKKENIYWDIHSLETKNQLDLYFILHAKINSRRSNV